MNGKDLWKAFNDVEEKYLQEAEEFPKRSRLRKHWWQPAAACLAVVVIGAAIVVPYLFSSPWTGSDRLIGFEQFGSWGGIGDMKNPWDWFTGLFDGSEEDLSHNQEESIQVSLSDVPVNQLSSLPQSDLSYLALMEDQRITWTKEQVEDYYGLHFDAMEVPAGMQAQTDLSQGMPVWINDDGSMRFDGLKLYFTQDASQQEYPEGTEKSFSLTASKIGLLNLSDSLYRTDTVKTWRFQGTEITIGYCAMSYGPYDETTHAPAGTYPVYPVYTAEFEYGGAQYRLVGQRISRRDMVTAVATLLSQGEDVEIIS